MAVFGLTFVKSRKNFPQKLKKRCIKFWRFRKKSYLCTRLTGSTPAKAQKKEFFERFT